MFWGESSKVKKLRIDLAEQRRINARLRRKATGNRGQRRILDNALEDAEKLISLCQSKEPTTREAVAGLISERRYTYAMALLKSAGVVIGGGRGKPYRWRLISEREMIDRARGAHERHCANDSFMAEHLPKHLLKRVRSASPTATI